MAVGWIAPSRSVMSGKGTRCLASWKRVSGIRAASSRTMRARKLPIMGVAQTGRPRVSVALSGFGSQFS
eukprot:7811911-Alexandrium_andersonii.AAC.1